MGLLPNFDDRLEPPNNDCPCSCHEDGEEHSDCGECREESKLARADEQMDKERDA